MNRPSTLLVAGTTAVLLALAGCSAAGSETATPSAAATPLGDPVEGGTLTYATDVQPQAGGLDPYANIAFANQNVTVQIYESLLTRSDDGTIEPLLASSYDQPDDLTYVFHLREGVTFSDGTPLTADDVVFSFQTLQGTAAAMLLTGLADITATDPSTVTFTFSSPNGSFLNLAATRSQAPIVSKAWYEATPAEERQTGAVGTGPFTLESWKDQVSVTLSKNPTYWGEAPHVDTLEFLIVPDETARLSTLQQGDADAAWIRDPQLAAQAESAGQLAFGANAVTRSLSMYVNATEGALSDIKVRQALSKGIDRDQIIQVATYGYGKKSFVAPVGDPASIAPDAETPNYTYDVEGAKALLSEAGTPAVTVPIYYAADASFALDVPVVEIMKEQLAEVGITLDLKAVPWADILTRYTTGDWEGLILVPGTYQGDVTSYFSFLFPGVPFNQLGDAGQVALGQLSQVMAEGDPTARLALLDELTTTVAQDVLVLVPFAQPQRQELWADSLQGYSVDPYTYRSNLKSAWVVD